MVFKKALTVQEKDRINIYTQITNAFLYHQLVSASWTNHTHTSLLAAANCCSPGSNATGLHTNVPGPRHASSSSPSPAPQLCVSSFHVRRPFNGNFRNAQRKTSQFSQLLACVFPPTLSSSNFSMSKVFLVRESHLQNSELIRVQSSLVPWHSALAPVGRCQTDLHQTPACQIAISIAVAVVISLLLSTSNTKGHATSTWSQDIARRCQSWRQTKQLQYKQGTGRLAPFKPVLLTLFL